MGREWRGLTSSRIDEETYLASLRRGGTEIKRSRGTFAETLHGIYMWTRSWARFIVDPKLLSVPVDGNFGQKKKVVLRLVPLATLRRGVEKTSCENCELEMIYRVKRMTRITRDKLTHSVMLSSILVI